MHHSVGARSLVCVLFALALVCPVVLAAATQEADVLTISVGDSVAKPQQPGLPLDVGVVVTTGVVNNSGTDMESSFRETEAKLVGTRMRRELEAHEGWGVVRLFPEPSVIPQVTLELNVLISDGAQLSIAAFGYDVSGRVLLDRTYNDVALESDYLGEGADPFNDLFVRVHVDMLSALMTEAPAIAVLKSVSFLRYAQALVPEAFSGYLSHREGRWYLIRLPSGQDPMGIRLKKLQEYELLFIDTIDEQIRSIEAEVGAAYSLWRRASKEQLDWLELRRSRDSDEKKFTDDSAFTRLQAVYAAYRSLKIHEQELFELVLDLESEARSTALYVEKQVFKLTGTLEQQYREWRSTLLRINDLESLR